VVYQTSTRRAKPAQGDQPIGRINPKTQSMKSRRRS